MTEELTQSKVGTTHKESTNSKKLKASKTIDLLKLLSSSVGPNWNRFYIRTMQDKTTKLPSTQSLSLTKYYPLLEIINFDYMIGMLHYRCNRAYYDYYKTKLEKNGSYHVDDENSLEMAKQLFGDLLDDRVVTAIATSKVERPYDCASHELKINLMKDLLLEACGDLIKIDAANKVLFYKQNDEVKMIQEYRNSDFAKFLAYPLGNLLAAKQIIEVIEDFIEQFEGAASKTNVIQFNDCYLEKGEIIQGFYNDGFPRFMIKRDVYEAVNSGKTTVHSKELDELMLHLCNYDETTKERFLDVMSTVFLNDASYKQRFNFSPRIVGKDGGNGKTIFKSVIENAFGGHGSPNVAAFKMSKLYDPRTIYHVVQSLVAIDGDSSTTMINDDASETFKQITTGDPVPIRALYSEEFELEAMTMMIAFSNDFPMSSDKSNAYLRRLEYIRCDYQLLPEEKLSELGPNSKPPKIKLDQAWYDEVRSDKAAQYLIEMMLLRSQRIKKAGNVSNMSKQMVMMKNQFAQNNNSALAFLDEFGAESIVGFTVKEVKDQYQEWCDNNDLTVMKKKFNETLEASGFSRLRVPFRYLDTSSNQFIRARETKEKLVAWQYSKDKANSEHFRALHADNRYEYQFTKEEIAAENEELSTDRATFDSNSNELFSSTDLEAVKLFIDTFYTSKDKEFNNIPVSTIASQFESYSDFADIPAVGRQTLNRVIEHLGYERKNISVSRAKLTDDESKRAEKDDRSMVRCWVKCD